MRAKYTVGVIAGLLLLSLTSCPTPYTKWAKLIGGSGSDYAEAVIATADGGYAVVGSTDSDTGTNGLELYFVVRNADGDHVYWSKIGHMGDDQGFDLQQTPDGGFVCAGQFSTDPTGTILDTNLWLLRNAPTGTNIWNHIAGDLGDFELARAVDQTSDGGYITAGLKSGTSSDMWLVKWDSLGVEQWDLPVGGTGSESAFAGQQTTDGGYMLAGWTDSYGAGNRDMYLVKLTSAPALSWHQTYGGTGDEGAEAAQQTTDGGYILAGESTSFSTDGNWDAYIVKTDASGVVEWQRVIGGPYFDGAKDIKQDGSGYIVVVETFADAAGTDRDIQLIKLRADGSTQWVKTFGGTAQDRPTSVALAHDGGYVVAGYANSWTASGDMDVYLIKTDPRGNAPATPSI